MCFEVLVLEITTAAHIGHQVFLVGEQCEVVQKQAIGGAARTPVTIRTGSTGSVRVLRKLAVSAATVLGTVGWDVVPVGQFAVFTIVGTAFRTQIDRLTRGPPVPVQLRLTVGDHDHRVGLATVLDRAVEFGKIAKVGVVPSEVTGDVVIRLRYLCGCGFYRQIIDGFNQVGNARVAAGALHVTGHIRTVGLPAAGLVGALKYRQAESHVVGLLDQVGDRVLGDLEAGARYPVGISQGIGAHRAGVIQQNHNVGLDCERGLQRCLRWLGQRGLGDKQAAEQQDPRLPHHPKRAAVGRFEFQLSLHR